MRVHHEDARPYLRRTDARYDAIMVDVYRQPYIPFYLVTREFFELARDRLRPGGVVIVNVGHPEGQQELDQVLGATMADVFGTVLRDPDEDTNTMLVGDRRGCLGGAAPRAAPGCPPICATGGRAPPPASRPRLRAAPSTPTTRRRSSGWWTSRSFDYAADGE